MITQKRFSILLASLLIGVSQVSMANDCLQIRQELETEKDNVLKRHKLKKKLKKCEEAARAAAQNPSGQQPPPAYPNPYPSQPAAGYPYPSSGASPPNPAPYQEAPPAYPNQYPAQPPAGQPYPPNAAPPYPAPAPGAYPPPPAPYPAQPAAGYPYPPNAAPPSYPAPYQGTPPAYPNQYPAQQPVAPTADPCDPLRKALGNDKSNIVLAIQLNRCIKKANKAAQNQ